MAEQFYIPKGFFDKLAGEVSDPGPYFIVGEETSPVVPFSLTRYCRGDDHCKWSQSYYNAMEIKIALDPTEPTDRRAIYKEAISKKDWLSEEQKNGLHCELLQLDGYYDHDMIRKIGAWRSNNTYLHYIPLPALLAAADRLPKTHFMHPQYLDGVPLNVVHWQGNAGKTCHAVVIGPVPKNLKDVSAAIESIGIPKSRISFACLGNN